MRRHKFNSDTFLALATASLLLFAVTSLHAQGSLELKRRFIGTWRTGEGSPAITVIIESAGGSDPLALHVISESALPIGVAIREGISRLSGSGALEGNLAYADCKDCSNELRATNSEAPAISVSYVPDGPNGLLFAAIAPDGSRSNEVHLQKISDQALTPSAGPGPASSATLHDGDTVAAGGQKMPDAPTTLNVADVRLTQVDSRPLSGAEMAALRDSLRWEPLSAPLPRGGTAVSYLVDKDEHRLGSIRVQWTKTVVLKGASSQPGVPAVGYFTLQMENETSCGFLGEAELDDAKGFVIVNSVDLDSWVGLGQPGSGQTIQVEGNADLPNTNPSIVLKPLEVGATLSACTTPKNP